MVAALRQVGRLSRAARMSRCGPHDPLEPSRRWCGDRLCPACKWRWVRLHRGRLRAFAKSAEGSAFWVTLKTAGVRATYTLDKHRRLFERFARRATWSMVGAHHLERGTRGGWLAHSHVLVYGGLEPERVCKAVHEAWSSAGGADDAWIEPGIAPSAAIDYALEGALKPPSDATARCEWLEAIIGVRLVFSIARAIPIKRRNAPATPERDSGEGDQRIAARVYDLLATNALSSSALKRKFTSGDRLRLKIVLYELEASGVVTRVSGARGDRFRVEGENAEQRQ
jgi:hypothetical protein